MPAVFGARQQNGARVVDVRLAEESVGKVRVDLDDLLRHQAMRLAMDSGGGLGARCVEQAKDLAAILVEPIFEAMDAMLVLHRKVGVMRLLEPLGCRPLDIMDVYV